VPDDVVAAQHVLLELTRLDWVAGPLAQPIEVPRSRREGVSSVARHAGARHVTITLDVVSEVVDEGRGLAGRAAEPRAACP
jgi:signal transduction histidine kinase